MLLQEWGTSLKWSWDHRQWTTKMLTNSVLTGSSIFFRTMGKVFFFFFFKSLHVIRGKGAALCKRGEREPQPWQITEADKWKTPYWVSSSAEALFQPMLSLVSHQGEEKRTVWSLQGWIYSTVGLIYWADTGLWSLPHPQTANNNNTRLKTQTSSQYPVIIYYHTWFSVKTKIQTLNQVSLLLSI